MKNIFKRINRRDGSVAIESILSMTVFLILFVAMLGLFLAMYPRILLLQEMHSITRLAEMQGGLTAENVEFFEGRIGDFGFVSNPADVELAVVTDSGIDATTIDEKGAENPFYIKREDFDAMSVSLKVPVNNSVFHSAIQFFGVDGTLSDYEYQELVFSERY